MLSPTSRAGLLFSRRQRHVDRERAAPNKSGAVTEGFFCSSSPSPVAFRARARGAIYQRVKHRARDVAISGMATRSRLSPWQSVKHRAGMWRSRAWQREVGCATRGANPERRSQSTESVHASTIDQHQLLDVGVASTHVRGSVRCEGGVAHPRVVYAQAIRARARSRDPGLRA